MRQSRISRIAVGAMVAAAAAAGTVMGGGAPATAAQVYTVNHSRTSVVVLNHAETVAAAQVGAGHLINAVLGNDHWGVTLESDSRYSDRWYYRPDKGRAWNNVTGQQLVAEAAAHPGGRVALGYTPSIPDHPLWVQQLW
ncbi:MULTISPECIES: hypothetical protein [Williamsia]|uniref:Uncharacterized protein n=1 Tax=Williamsia maris TaxID=72806 RepID=A0ABT1HBS8_9NOCA|nr:MULTISPECIES: hypothetical protein [Williamsia]MBJ7291429.1 hypothetical protein [Williamsia sp.]MCP2175709.1 hypothetical protein [Williamsia maris]